MEKPLKVRLHVLSPIHIGCDDVYEPTSFVINENTKKLVEFDPIEFIKSLSIQDKMKFSSLCMQGNIPSIIGIYKFISGKSIDGREVEIANELPRHYKRVRDFSLNDEDKIKQELNKFSIGRTAYNHYTSLPYIPGSSIKGSLRTAYLNALAKHDNIPPFKGKAADFEKVLLKGSFDSDPFRLVHISDFQPVGNIKTKIYYAVNKKKRISRFEARGPFQILETVQGKSIFEGTINILNDTDNEELIKRPVASDALYKSTHSFFNTMWNMDNNIFSEIGVGFSVYKDMPSNLSEKLGKSAFLLRLGRHSGAESMTIYGYRNIRIMQGKGTGDKYGSNATTLWLASESSKPPSNAGLIPFGWAVLELEPFDNIPIETVAEHQGEPRTDKFNSKDILKAPKTFPDDIDNTVSAPTHRKPEQILWQNVTLAWNPGNNIVSTTREGKNAEVKGIDRGLVPEAIRNRLFDKKKKKAVADIVVEHIGGNRFKIVEIREP